MLSARIRGGGDGGSDLPFDAELNRLDAHLRRYGYAASTRTRYLRTARRFLAFIDRRQLPRDILTARVFAAYLTDELQRHRARHGQSPSGFINWRQGRTKAVKLLLESCGIDWPPSPLKAWDRPLRQRLADQRCARRTRLRYMVVARRFAVAMERAGVPLEAVQPGHVQRFVSTQLRSYRQHRGCDPRDRRAWRETTRAPVHFLLRVVHGRWPPLHPVAS